MSLEPIEYRGELVALVGADRFHLISPHLLACPAGDAELRFVMFMCVCHRHAAETGLTGLAGDVLGRSVPGSGYVRSKRPGSWRRRTMASHDAVADTYCSSR
jgi:hypothetical protein